MHYQIKTMNWQFRILNKFNQAKPWLCNMITVRGKKVKESQKRMHMYLWEDRVSTFISLNILCLLLPLFNYIEIKFKGLCRQKKVTSCKTRLLRKLNVFLSKRALKEKKPLNIEGRGQSQMENPKDLYLKIKFKTAITEPISCQKRAIM